MKSLVLTGRILPGHDESQVWAKVAPLFKLDPEAFSKRILSRLPLSIKESADDAELQRLSLALQNTGADVETANAEGKWFLQQGTRIAGPVPLAYLKNERQIARLDGNAKVKQVMDKNWTTLAIAVEEPSNAFDMPPELEQEEPDDLPPPLPSPNLRPKTISSLTSTTQSTQLLQPPSRRTKKGTSAWKGLGIAFGVVFLLVVMVSLFNSDLPKLKLTHDKSNIDLPHLQALCNSADVAKAFACYRDAAEQGNALGQLYVGISYTGSVPASVEKNDVEAAIWIRKAAEQGNADAEVALGTLYIGGTGVQKDDVQAVSWFRKAADQNNANGKYLLGLSYQDGLGGLKKDKPQAISLLQQSAEAGNQKAAAALKEITTPKMSEKEIQECELFANIQLRVMANLATVYGTDWAKQNLMEQIKKEKGQACLERVGMEWFNDSMNKR